MFPSRSSRSCRLRREYWMAKRNVLLKSRGASETVNYSESDQQPDACERVSLSPNNKFVPGLSDDNGDILRDFSKLGCCQKITTLLTSSHQFNNLQVRRFIYYFNFNSELVTRPVAQIMYGIYTITININHNEYFMKTFFPIKSTILILWINFTNKAY